MFQLLTPSVHSSHLPSHILEREAIILPIGSVMQAWWEMKTQDLPQIVLALRYIEYEVGCHTFMQVGSLLGITWGMLHQPCRYHTNSFNPTEGVSLVERDCGREFVYLVCVQYGTKQSRYQQSRYKWMLWIKMLYYNILSVFPVLYIYTCEYNNEAYTWSLLWAIFWVDFILGSIKEVDPSSIV
jgi:hypothetical protein